MSSTEAHKPGTAGRTVRERRREGGGGGAVGGKEREEEEEEEREEDREHVTATNKVRVPSVLAGASCCPSKGLDYKLRGTERASAREEGKGTQRASTRVEGAPRIKEGREM
jgi:hypothetical protein